MPQYPVPISITHHKPLFPLHSAFRIFMQCHTLCHCNRKQFNTTQHNSHNSTQPTQHNAALDKRELYWPQHRSRNSHDHSQNSHHRPQTSLFVLKLWCKKAWLISKMRHKVLIYCCNASGLGINLSLPSSSNSWFTPCGAIVVSACTRTAWPFNAIFILGLSFWETPDTVHHSCIVSPGQLGERPLTLLGSRRPTISPARVVVVPPSLCAEHPSPGTFTASPAVAKYNALSRLSSLYSALYLYGDKTTSILPQRTQDPRCKTKHCEKDRGSNPLFRPQKKTEVLRPLSSSSWILYVRRTKVLSLKN